MRRVCRFPWNYIGNECKLKQVYIISLQSSSLSLSLSLSNGPLLKVVPTGSSCPNVCRNCDILNPTSCTACPQGYMVCSCECVGEYMHGCAWPSFSWCGLARSCYHFTNCPPQRYPLSQQLLRECLLKKAKLMVINALPICATGIISKRVLMSWIFGNIL